MIVDELNDRLADVNHSAPSVAKYQPIKVYLADLLQLPQSAVYATYISKAGNAGVRAGQSPKARSASLIIALIDPPPHESLVRQPPFVIMAEAGGNRTATA